MIRLKTPEEIEMMRRAGRAVAEALAAMRDAIVPGETTTLDLDEVAAEVLKKRGAKPALLGYKPSLQPCALPAQHLYLGQQRSRAWSAERQTRLAGRRHCQPRSGRFG